MSRSADRVLAGIVVLVLLLGGVVAWIATHRVPAAYEPGTPEAVTQAFLTAALDRDHDTVVGLLADDRCSLNDVARAFVPRSARVVLLGTVVRSDEASVRVEVTETSGGLLDGGGWMHEEVVTLVRDGDSWLVEPDSWPFHGCDGW